jgi:hypothetical protein
MFVFLFFSVSDPFTMIYLEGDRGMLTCTGEYNETIQISSVLNMAAILWREQVTFDEIIMNQTVFAFTT